MQESFFDDISLSKITKDGKFKADFKDVCRFQDYAFVSYQISASILAMARLRVSEKIGYSLESKRSSDDIASEINVSKDFLYRTMHFLAMNGFYIEVEHGVFQNNSTSLALADESVRDETIMMNGVFFYRCYETLPETIQVGTSQVGKALHYPGGVWDFLADHKQDEIEFTKGMTAITTRQAPLLAKLGDYNNYETVCDIGGSQGIFIIREFLKIHSDIKKVINFDQPTVFNNQKNSIRERLLLDQRYSECPGNFFESVPSADCYILKSILHDWSDEKARLILNTIAKSINPDGKVYLNEYIVDDGKKENELYISSLDHLMLQLCNAKERSRAQWEELVSETAFKVENKLNMESKEIRNIYNATYDSITKFQDFTYAGYLMSSCLRTVSLLNVSNVLGHSLESKRSSLEIAREVGADPVVLQRVLHYLATNGFYIEVPNEPGVFKHNEYSLTLADPLVRDETIFLTGPSHYRAFESLVDTVRTGESQSDKALKENFWDFIKNNNEANSEFANGMTAKTTRLSPAIAELGNYSKFETVCDVGGSQGILISEILKQYQNVKNGINFDQPSVFKNLEKVDRPYTFDSRYSEVGGNFFESVPVADCYTMKYILHDWDDEKSKLILNTIAKAIKPNGKVHIIELILDDGVKGNEKYLATLDLL
ncbi:hypothetical protein PPL_05307 [Heterostelium album PN500]|uniref:O-methyltransferase n=1 Tax=Heterostelium pallidum (strain ATCC 26659 / Pp 5 / PN500) TaxID=670386 RepID=D3BBC0_HETP5|nr:hypothetical protein PPL_05307 [Heterostelium album PN500]EFA81327.1 hypothetical protein PPL_05307 [Heterostelium album PN500]|eukprot:XP_020433445.1 hypothetical protein PPL_05307 [Heterostelium album PN500]